MEDINEITRYLDKANEIARNQDWRELAKETLRLLVEICQAESAIFYHSILNTPQIPPYGQPKNVSRIRWEALRASLNQAAFFQTDEARYYDQPELERWTDAPAPGLYLLNNLTIIPCRCSDETRGGFMILNSQCPRLEIAALIARRMVSDLEKAMILEASYYRQGRLMEMSEILGKFAANLDKDKVLRSLMNQARQFLDVEAVSLFLVDEQTKELVLELASQQDENVKVEKLRVPPGQGIIGATVQTGKSILVDNAQRDERHYEKMDRTSGFNTRGILSVPLLSRPIDLGRRGTSPEKIIGGVQALNKSAGQFRQEDMELLQIMAKGAATIHVIAQLYEDSNTMFLGILEALVAVIDARDPYTQGHSRRVREFSTEIANTIGLPAEEVYYVSLGSLLHDVGKIGIPDAVLLKKGPLDPDERKIIKLHPEIGERIFQDVHLLSRALPAISEHHERLDGSGYPRGLSGDRVSLFGRIVAVADSFDAMTSNRPYRAAKTAEVAFDELEQNSGTHFDPKCVKAIISAYLGGRIKTQVERER
jgi:HD-GYP domain-containing protein (c-di-GMP phosphodiesterase class II)